MFKSKAKMFLMFLISVVVSSFLSCVSLANKEVVILHTNDVHARAKDDKREIGYARFCTYLKDLRKNLKNSPIVLDAGDVLHGKIIAIADSGESIVHIMNKIGYTAMVPGNHDFNYGADRLLELSNMANFKVLSANVTDLRGNTIFIPYIVEERAGVKIGIFGLCTPETVIKTNPKNVKGIKFQECIEVSRQMVQKLKDEGVDAVVCLGHIGLEPSSVITSDVICSNVSGIDLFIDGHSHTRLDEGMKIGDTYIVSTGQYLNNIGKVTMLFGDDNKLKNIKCELISKQDVLSLEEDKEILQLIEDIEKRQWEGGLGEVITHTDVVLNGERKQVRRGSTNMSRMLSESLYEYTNADVAILNGGTIRDSLYAGDITKMDIISVLPFNNILVTKKMTGSQIKKVLEEGVGYYPAENGGFPDIAGMTYKFDPKRPKGSRVISIEKDGKEIKMNKEYVVALSDYLDEGGDNYPFADIPFIDEHIPVNEVFTEYLKNTPVTEESNDIMKETHIVFTPIDDLFTYKVSKDDMLSYIADKYNVDVYDIAKINNLDLENPEIHEGQVLFIRKTILA